MSSTYIDYFEDAQGRRIAPQDTFQPRSRGTRNIPGYNDDPRRTHPLDMLAYMRAHGDIPTVSPNGPNGPWNPNADPRPVTHNFIDYNQQMTGPPQGVDEGAYTPQEQEHVWNLRGWQQPKLYQPYAYPESNLSAAYAVPRAVQQFVKQPPSASNYLQDANNVYALLAAAAHASRSAAAGDTAFTNAARQWRGRNV